MKVAIYAIALNEEKFVKRWAESAKEADYIILGDTGSTDRTIELAQECNVTVEEVIVSPWRFDMARNALLARVPRDVDFCIALDLDEVLVPGWRQVLEKTIKENPNVTRPRYKYIWSWQDSKETIPGIQFAGELIHARHGYRWIHPVHEILVTYGHEEVSAMCDLEMRHHADNTKSRAQYLPLLELAVKEDPYGDRNLHYLAREYYFQRRYPEAVEFFKRHLEVSSWNAEKAASLRMLAECDPENAVDYLREAVRLAPEYRESWLAAARQAYFDSNWEDCLYYASFGLELTERPHGYLTTSEAWEGPELFDYAAIASYQLNDFDSAVKYGKQAAQVSDDERLQFNLEFYQRAQSNRL
jgi:tetratricopeptide (TPR) repeat protein